MQARMFVNVPTIIDQRRIAVELLRDLGMPVEVAIGGRQRMRTDRFTPMLVVPFVRHEAIRMMLQLRADFRMILEVLVEARMSRKVLRVIDQSRIVGQLLGHFGMLVEVTVVEMPDFTASDSVTAAAV